MHSAERSHSREPNSADESIACTLTSIMGAFVPRPPNYRQDKKRREEAQKRRNEEEQLRKAERKNKDRSGEPTSS